MIQQGDLSRLAQVRVSDGLHRTWRTLWLKPEHRWRVVYYGVIDSFYRDSHKGASLALVDPLQRLEDVRVDLELVEG